MSLKMKIFTLVAVSILILSGFTIFYLGSQSINIIEEEELERSNELENIVQRRIDEEIYQVEAAALFVANNREVQRLFAEGDRDGLIENLEASYENTKQEFPQIHFHLPDSTSFLRVHRPERYGDDLSDIREAVNLANRENRIVRGLEEGRSGYAIRAIIPMVYQEEHLGTMEFGAGFDESFLEVLRRDFSGEYFIYNLDREEESPTEAEDKLLAGTTEDEWQASTDDILEIKNNNSIRRLMDGNRYSVNLIPFYDYDDQVTGYIKVVQDRSEVLNQISSIRRNVIIIFLLGLAIILSVIYYFLDKSFEPLERVSDFAEEVAAGNLRVEKLAVKDENEIGTLSKSVNKMLVNLREIIYNISDKAEDISAYSEELSASAQEGNASIETTSGLIKEISVGIEEISASSEEIASFSQEASTQTNMGSQNIEDTVNSIKEINKEVDETVAVINELDHNSEEIGQIIELITSIAEQTNLLALNAAIEAARAGEHGQGFAVVADEIRQLASETSDATDKISSLVNETQKQSKKGLEKVKSVEIKAKDGEKIARETGSVFDEIKDSVEQTSEQIEQTAKASNDLAQNSDEIINATEDINNMSNEITNSSEELAQMAQQLQNLIEEFKV